jgi:hypothetical protein
LQNVLSAFRLFATSFACGRFFEMTWRVSICPLAGLQATVRRICAQVSGRGCFKPARFCLQTSLGLALVFFAGCATSTPKLNLTGDILVDGPNAISNGPARDKVLWQYRTAVAAMRQGKYDMARPLLDDALLTLGGIYGGDPEAKKARSYFHGEAKKTFIGEPYERSMAYFYRGILYWMDGQLDNARACFRSAEFEDSDAENKKYAGDWVLPDYLDGLATTLLGGDGSDAFNRASTNSHNIHLPPYQTNANVLVFVEFGPSTVKYATGQYAQELRFRIARSPIIEARLRTGSINIPIAPCDDVYFQATTRGGRVMDHILGNKAVFKSTTDTVGNVALIGGLSTAAFSGDRTAQQVGLGIALAGLISKAISAAANPEADIRTWDNLPQHISFASLTLPKGQHQLTFEFLDSSRQPMSNLTKIVNLEITDTETDKVVFVSDQSATPQTL